MRRLALAPLVALLLAAGLAGCVDPSAIVPDRFRGDAPSHWSYEIEPAMAPDLTGHGETYPVLLVHQHYVPSKRQREEQPPVVCLAMDGSPMPLSNARKPSMDMAACLGPAADPPTARVFVPREEFDARAPDALAVMMDACAGGVVYLDDAQSAFRVSTARHDFAVRLADNGTFLVDGRWIEPGTTLKVGYYVAYGDARDQAYVRVAFEAPGRWPVARVGGYGEDLGENVPPRPMTGSGLVVDVPLAPPSLREPVEAALAATPFAVEGIDGLRAVHDGERLTELTLRLTTEHGVVTWYGAGRTGERMRLLGALDEGARSGTVPAPADALVAAFDLPWADLRPDAAERGADVRLAVDTRWSSALTPVALSAPVAAGCEAGCVRVLARGAWEELLAPTASAAEGQLTLQVLPVGEGGAAAWWHAPERPLPSPRNPASPG